MSRRAELRRAARSRSGDVNPAMGPPRWWRRRHNEVRAKHTRQVTQTNPRDPGNERARTLVTVHTTKAAPWTVKRRRRAANRIARRSRKGNR